MVTVIARCPVPGLDTVSAADHVMKTVGNLSLIRWRFYA